MLETAYSNKILVHECWFKLLSSQMICRLDKVLLILSIYNYSNNCNNTVIVSFKSKFVCKKDRCNDLCN